MKQSADILKYYIKKLGKQGGNIVDWKIAVITCVSFFAGYITCGLLSFNDRFDDVIDLDEDE